MCRGCTCAENAFVQKAFCIICNVHSLHMGSYVCHDSFIHVFFGNCILGTRASSAQVCTLCTCVHRCDMTHAYMCASCLKILKFVDDCTLGPLLAFSGPVIIWPEKEFKKLTAAFVRCNKEAYVHGPFHLPEGPRRPTD